MFEEGDVKKCGFFVSKKFPQFGCSPDGIANEWLIEIKCPYLLKDTTPTDLSKLSVTQKRSFWLQETPYGVQLDKKHKYYYQCQWQMFVTGFKKLKFIVQTPYGLFTEDVLYDEKCVNDLLPAIIQNYDQVFVPEIFEMRSVRGLNLIKLE